MSSYDFPPTGHLTESAEFLLRSVLESGPFSSNSTPNTTWWLKVLLEKRGPMAEDMIQGLQARTVIQSLDQRLDDGESLVSMTTEELVDKALVMAFERGKEKIHDRDIMAAILVYLDDTTNTGESSAEEKPRIMAPTPTLDKIGVDLTSQARKGKLDKIIGREKEMQQVMETLCRQKKRNPALIGPAGVGKTAIIEGLAQLIVADAVPEPLKNSRLISLQATALVAGASAVGDLEKRLSAVLKEASQPGILLFIDEVHTIMGAGGATGTGDVASLLKPALARGDMACIVATTDVEYRKHIAADAALERRFNPVLVNEISMENTMLILQSFRDHLKIKRDVNVDDETLESLLMMAERFMRNRRFPDKALDLLDHCVASAITQGKTEVTIKDAQVIVQQIVGMPTNTKAGLSTLKKRLKKTRFLQEDDAEDLIYRLGTTTENLDLAPQKPNAVLLLHGKATKIAVDLANSVAESIFGSINRVVRIDLSGLSQDHHIDTLIGSPVGYVGHGSALPHDPVQQTPWCVVLWENIHLCHPSIRAILTRALQTGMLQDNRGYTTFFSDAVIIATVSSQSRYSSRSVESIGFDIPDFEAGNDGADDVDLEKAVSSDFFQQCDLIIDQTGASSSAGELWIKENLLNVTKIRYADRGLSIKWDKTFVDWLNYHKEKPATLKEWEGLLDEKLNPALRKVLDKNKIDRPKAVVVRSLKGKVVVEPEGENNGV